LRYRGFDISLHSFIAKKGDKHYIPTPTNDLSDAREFFHFTHSVWTILINGLLYFTVIVIGKAIKNIYSSQENEGDDLSVFLDQIIYNNSKGKVEKEQDLAHQVFRMYVVE